MNSSVRIKAKHSRTLGFFFCAVVSTVAFSQSPSAGIRSVDFKNFSYPWVEPSVWPDHLQWMSLRLNQHVRLADGRSVDRDGDDKDVPFAGLTLEGVQYAKLSDERSEDAVVVLRYDSGGTQYHYWVYIYAGSNEPPPALLGFFHAGDRATYGLYKVFARNRILHVQLFDPKHQEGDCCSSGYLDYQFRWNGRGFGAAGSPIPRRVDSTSRRPVSIFGLPLDQH
jgi:hypothetical protein